MTGEQSKTTETKTTYSLGGSEASLIAKCIEQLTYFLAEATALKIKEKKKLEEELQAYQDDNVKRLYRDVIRLRLQVEYSKLQVEESKLKAEKRRIENWREQKKNAVQRRPVPPQQAQQSPPNGNIAAESKATDKSEDQHFANKIKGVDKVMLRTPSTEDAQGETPASSAPPHP